VNSLVSDFLDRPFLYETTNLTRSITGYGMGLVMATALITLFNVTVWKECENIPILRSPIQLALYGVLAGAINLLILSNSEILFRLAAYLAIFTAMAIITLLYSVFWIILLKKENTITSIRGLWVFLAAGFATCMLQITLMITLRSSVL